MEPQVKRSSVRSIAPVFFAFFVMSFVDLVGTGVDEFKSNAQLNNFQLQLIASVAFIWFFFLSVPAGILQDRYGKKNMLNISMVITGVGLFLPALGGGFGVMLLAFSMVGIGNTIIQVSANPLLLDVVPKHKGSSALSFSQAIKSIGSFVGPFVAIFFTSYFDDWKYALYLFGAISILVALWLHYTPLEESETEEKKASFSSCLKLLGNRYVLMMVMCIFLIVGLDVGMNTNISAVLFGNYGIDEEVAKTGKSVYFISKMTGCFLGAVLLTVITPRKFLVFSSFLTIVGVLIFALTKSDYLGWASIVIISLGASNIFPLIFSITVRKMPTRSNEIAGLMMMAIVGGAAIPPLMGLVSDVISVTASVYVLLICMIYILLVAVSIKPEGARAKND